MTEYNVGWRFALPADDAEIAEAMRIVEALRPERDEWLKDTGENTDLFMFGVIVGVMRALQWKRIKEQCRTDGVRD